MNEPKIMSKIDWTTIMYYDVCLLNLFDLFGLDNSIAEDEFVNNAYENNQGWDKTIVINYSDVRFEIGIDDFYNSTTETIFTHIFKKIRVDFSGKTLDILRNNGLDVDHDFINSDFISNNGYYAYNITRMDFAFDFIDYKPEFFEKFYNHLQYLDNNRFDTVRCKGTCKPMNFSIRTGGGQRTIYLGSTSGNKLLRMYDKRLQYIRYDGSIIQPLPENIGHCNSWYRMELQTRRKECGIGLDLGSNGLEVDNCLRFIFEHYAMVDENGKVLDFIKDFYNIDGLPPIIHNLSLLYKMQIVDRCNNFVKGTALKSIVTLIAYYGLDGFVEQLNNVLHKHYHGNRRSDAAFRRSLFMQLHELQQETDIHKLNLLYESDGYYIERGV